MSAPSPLRAGTDPALDPVGTVRVHPDDDPRASDARRVVCTDEPAHELRWDIVTGSTRVEPPSTFFRTDDQVAGWPVQPLWHLAVVLGHGPAVDDALAELDREYASGWARGREMTGHDLDALDREIARFVGVTAWMRGRADGARAAAAAS